MPALLSLVTSVKDYIEIAHKLVETQNTNFFLSQGLGDQSGLAGLSPFFGKEPQGDYNEFGAVLTYVVLSVKEFLTGAWSPTGWFKTIWSLPLVVPDVASAMISEISVLDSYFTNTFSFLENGLSANLNSNVNTLSMATENLVNAQKLNQNPALFGFEKFVIGFFNSFFLFLPTSTAHLITLRRFVMQGIEAGFMAGLGTIAGNFLWLASIILGLRFIVIPWLSLDILRYVLGFMLLVKYLWDSSKELNNPKKSLNLDLNSQIQIFALNFLLALTEQTSIYPFISNMSFGADGSIMEGFSNFGFSSGGQFLFFGIHACYLLGILLGSFSLLQFTVWFWENPAFSIYMWMISSYRVTTSSYYKVLNFVFLYLTMLCAISSIPYFGLDYTVTNPLGMIPQDRIIDQRSFSATGPGEPIFPEASFLGVKATDKNSRIRDGVHARRERWKERLIKYQAFDASLYDQGAYDILTVEDLNYGFDRFWLRRKMRNHQIRFRLFPGPWMRSVKKQLNKPGFTGPRTEFFRILFEQYYHPSFHATANKNKTKKYYPPGTFAETVLRKQDQKSNARRTLQTTEGFSTLTNGLADNSILVPSSQINLSQNSRPSFRTQKGLISEYSALRKFSQNVNTRLNAYSAAMTSGTSMPNKLVKQVLKSSNPINKRDTGAEESKIGNKLIYSKSLKSLFNKINKEYTKTNLNLFRNLSKNLLVPSKSTTVLEINNFSSNGPSYGKLPAWQSNTKGSDQTSSPIFESFKKTSMRKPLSKKERALLISGGRIKAAQISGAGYAENALGSKNLGLSTNNPVSSLNFYFKKNEAFKRKLQYYSTAVTRKFSVGNNAPYFKTILKRAFYYHKPTLRLKRTMFTAAMRRGFRKKSVMPKKLIYTTNSLTTDPTLYAQSAVGKTNPYLAKTTSLLPPDNVSKQSGSTNTINLPTQQYSVLGKRASRYRYQIYKDVLQHWYYTPFNRLLLKFDVDSFINRQPKSHFLTKKEERLLHLRRVLLADHYNTLRWYTYMQHYRTMKSRIGGTKSFASTAYNQQFQGTFKKIRHLFAITPIQGDMSVLKFDQLLYTDSNLTQMTALNGQSLNSLDIPAEPKQSFTQVNAPNNSRGTSLTRRKYGISARRYAHEDLTKDIGASSGSRNSKNVIDQSLIAAGDLVKAEQQTKYEKMRVYINQKNYSALTTLLSGQKPMQNALRTELVGATYEQNAKADKLNTDLVILDLLKEAKKRINDQSFLKNYISHRIDKREQRNNETSKELRAQLETLKTWLSPNSSTWNKATLTPDSTNDLFNRGQTTTGVRKALNDGVIVLNNINPSLQTKAFITKQAALRTASAGEQKSIIFASKNQQIKETVTSIKNLTSLVDQIKTNSASLKVSGSEKLKVSKLTKNVLTKLTDVQSLLNTILKPFVVLQNKLLTKRTDKNLEWWRQKQRALNKRASSRKKERLNYLESNISSQQKQAPESSVGALTTGYNSYLLAPQGFTLPYSGGQVNKLESGNKKMLRDGANIKLSLGETVGVLRKKTDNSLEQSQDLTPLAKLRLKSSTTKLFKRFVLRKFRKKRSRGKSYRKPYYANIIRPKNATNMPPNSSDLVSNYLNNFTGILDTKSLAALQSDMSSNTMIANLAKEDKSVMFKEFKQNLVKTIATQAYSSAVSSTIKDEGLLESQKINSLKNLLVQGSIKKSPSKKRSKRTSRKRKRQKFSINHDRYRKRTNHGLGKLRSLAKKMKRIKSTQEFQNWWWNTYLPNYMTKQVAARSVSNTAPLGLSNSRYAPLSTTKALDIKRQSNSQISSSPKPLVAGDSNQMLNASPAQNSLYIENVTATSVGSTVDSEKPQILDKIYENLVDASAQAPNRALPTSSLEKSKFHTTTTIPFYAGWDESLRKFVVTNRLLSRRDAGFEVNLNGIFSSQIYLSNKTQNPNVAPVDQQAWQFTNAPINGLNEASFLYLQTEMPFNSYTIDQFIPNNQSFYAPLGWKRFQFRHSLLKNWLNNSRSSNNAAVASNKSIYLTNNSISNFEYFKDPLVVGSLSSSAMPNTPQKNSKLQNRRIKKRYKLLRQTPIQLMYVPTGSLLTETLPSHYISVFDKQYRFPRNRYLKLFLKRTNNSLIKNQAIADYSSNGLGEYKALGVSNDFTLRKRIKPKRKYHKKRFTKKDGLIFPRRRKFGNLESTAQNVSASTKSPSQDKVLDSENEFRLRPSMRANQNITKGATKSKKQGRNSGKANAIRLRQLRRREFQQVFKPLQRYQPRNGGFTWPGDYLRLQIIPMPKLEPNLNSQIQPNSSSTPTKVKTKISSQPIGLLPRKYLLQKHNLKVFKKKIGLKYGI